MTENRPELGRYIWIIVGLLMPVALLNYLDRQMLATMKGFVMHDIPSIQRDANWGYMLGQFKWVYAILSPVGGYLADRFSRRYMICGSLFVWSGITMATGFVTTYSGLLWTRSLMGISEAFYMPAALALIANYHTGKTRSRAVSLHQLAIYSGIIIGGFTGYAAEAPNIGWRFTFHLAGIVGMLYAVPLLMLVRDPKKPIVDSTDTRPKLSVPIAARELFTNGSFILLAICFTLPALAGWVVRDWMPVILKEKFNIGHGIAGVSATLYVNIASIAGVLIGGWLADRWVRKNIRGRTFVSALGMALFIPALYGVGNAGSLVIAICFLAIFGLGWGGFDCNNMPILSQIVRPELRATGYGIMNLVSIGCGGFADWGFGAMRDRNIPLQVIFGVFAGIALLSVFCVLLIRPKRELENVVVVA
ncbi:MAG: MFS transporter [Chthonomonadales bacterium]